MLRALAECTCGHVVLQAARATAEAEAARKAAVRPQNPKDVAKDLNP